jgi:hypothetical protein
MAEARNEEIEQKDWKPESVGNDATMKEHSHKEYEARDTKSPPSDPGPGGGDPPPPGTGQSTTRRGEDVGREEGKEFKDLGKNQADRPYGTNDPDDTGVAGGGPTSEDMPNLQHP